MRNKIFIVISILLVVAVLTISYLFKRGYQNFKQSLSNYESLELKIFEREKEEKSESFSSNQEIYQLFMGKFDISKSMIERDTAFTFLFLSSLVKYKVPSREYITCLYNKCAADVNNESNLAKIDLKEAELKSKFGDTFLQWYPKLKEEKIVRKTKLDDNCRFFFPEFFEISYDEHTWNEFSDFMFAYDSETKEAALKNSKLENDFASTLLATRNKLNNKVLDYFDNMLENKRSLILLKDNEKRSYNSSVLGLINYSVPRVTFDKNAFQSVAGIAFEEQWKYNSLSTGATPYSYCYGSDNYCSYGCSRVSVVTGGSHDVLVTIKNSNGHVVRHGYIKGGASFTFNVPDGRYQVFFYSGAGWNPEKNMTTTTCGTLFGGFVSAENFTKDNYIFLQSSVMTYELILQENGNFSTQPSSLDEAFN